MKISQLASTISLEKLNSILDSIELAPAQRAHLKFQAKRSLKLFFSDNEMLVLMNIDKFNQLKQ